MEFSELTLNVIQTLSYSSILSNFILSYFFFISTSGRSDKG